MVSHLQRDCNLFSYLPENRNTLGELKAIVIDAGDLLESIDVILELLGQMGSVSQSHWNGFVGQLGHLEHNVQGTTGLAQQVQIELNRHLERRSGGFSDH